MSRSLSDGKDRCVTVYRSQNGKRWIAQVKVDGKTLHLGTFNKREEAQEACAEANKPKERPLEAVARIAKLDEEGCIRWPGHHGDWYVSIYLSCGRWTKVHRAVCEAAHGAPPTFNSYVLHSCDNKHCINPNHLSWGSASQNAKDAVLRGRTPKGSKCKKSILTECEVKQARSLRRDGVTYSELERQFGISRGSLWHAINGNNWKHVK